MSKNLVIVESPAKARTISRFLDKTFEVKASMGHIRDLPEKSLGVDVDNDFKPNYIVPGDKKKIIGELKKHISKAEKVWLASDEDREGEAISWHLMQILDLDESHTYRIVFHEITKNAISQAIKNPRKIDQRLVDAQQARRVLDRLVGFQLSPLLWRKIKPALSAGRVQSVALRLIVEKEEEIKKFESKSSFRITADFLTAKAKNNSIKAELPRNLKNLEEAQVFLENCIEAEYTVANIVKKPAQKSPAPPFTTSTMQQEASRKLSFSVSKTMMVAQQLYESGWITYMRTDSVNLSKLALTMAKKEIESRFGTEYSHPRNFKTRSKGAQEAHEAIRPTYAERDRIEGTKDQNKLYELIWKRTMASQMSSAKIEKTTVNINISSLRDKLIAKGEVILFDGFLKLYRESMDDDEKTNDEMTLPPLKVGQKLIFQKMLATERFTKSPVRFSEASLVRRLEELGIGRPSTYAPIISTIQRRNYVEKVSRPGVNRIYRLLVLENGRIFQTRESEKTGGFKHKLVPTDIGTIVNNFLVKYFEDIMDYNFTARVEKEFDEIAAGKIKWNKMIREFYDPFIKKVKHTIQNSGKFSGERLLGTDPKSGKKVYAKIGRFGPIVQLGESRTKEKPQFASLKKDQSLDSITLADALELFRFPKELGKYEDAVINIALGRYGPYLKHRDSFYSLPKDEDIQDVDLEKAIKLINLKRENDKQKIIKEFDENKDLKILNGRWGPYLKYKNRNFKIPKSKNPKTLTVAECLELIKNSKPKKKKRK